MTIKEKMEWHYIHFLKHRYPYLWCKKLYKESIGRPCNFSHPKDINEKILWLSFFTDTSLWTTLADKYAVREYVKERIGEEYLLPLLGKWDNAEDIDFESLPNKFVIKPNNGSYDCCVVTDKSKADLEEIRRKMDFSLKHKFGYEGAEIHYTRMKPCIIVEKLLESDEIGGLVDYKLWCFNGKFHSGFICANRDNSQHRVDWNYYDCNWQRYPQNITEKFRNNFECPKPQNYELMIEYAEKLADGLPQARIDFYNIKGKIYFGEITLTSNYGMMPYYTQSVLDDMGAHCTLPERSFKEKWTTFCNRWLPKL